MRSLVNHRPDLRLRGLVRRCSDFEERSTGPVRTRELPTAEVVVIVDFGAGWGVEQAGAAPARHGSFLAGLDDGPATVEHDGFARCVQIDVTPRGARALLGLPLEELARRVVALEDVLGAEAGRLAERFAETDGSHARFERLDRLLLARAADAEPLRPDVTWAWRRLVETGGGVRVGALAHELGCSRRHLTGRFRAELGLPPKTLARILRFRRAAELLGGSDARLAEIAAACGYADQAHFNRDFRAFAGTTPSALAAT